jgi:hypothetical protein
MITSINQLNQEIEAIATAHLQVNGYFWGSIFDYTKTNEIVYPLINAYYPTGNITGNLTSVQLYIECSDKVYKDRSNLNDTESDTLQVLKDFYNVIKRSNRWNRIARVDSATISKFWERSADEIAGHTMVLSLTLFDTTSICNLPIEGYDYDTSLISSCQPVLVQNSDDSYTVTLQSGGSLILPDTTLNVYVNNILENSVTFATLSNQTINIQN